MTSDDAILPLLDALHETGSAASSVSGGSQLAPDSLVGGVLLGALRDPSQREAIVARIRYQEVQVPELDIIVTTPVDAIRCLVDGQWLRMPVSYDEQVAGCNLLGLISPTTQIVDAIRAAAKPIDNYGLNVVPGSGYDEHLDLVKAYVVDVLHKDWKTTNLGLMMSTLIVAQQFNANLDREIERRGYPADAFVRPLGKNWVIDERGLANGAANYGPLQGTFAGGKHNAQHYDYSQLFVDCIKVLARRISDGSVVDMRAFLAARLPTLRRQIARYGSPSMATGEPQPTPPPAGRPVRRRGTGHRWVGAARVVGRGGGRRGASLPVVEPDRPPAPLDPRRSDLVGLRRHGFGAVQVGHRQLEHPHHELRQGQR